MPTHPAPSLEQARSINSKRLAVLLSFVGVLGLIRIAVYPVPNAAFLVFAFWLLGGLIYDLGMKKAVRFVPLQAMQAMMFALDITGVAILHARVGG